MGTAQKERLWQVDVTALERSGPRRRTANRQQALAPVASYMIPKYPITGRLEPTYTTL